MLPGNATRKALPDPFAKEAGMACEAIGCSERTLQHPPVSGFGLAVDTITEALRTLLWTLPPARVSSEFRTHGARLR